MFVCGVLAVLLCFVVLLELSLSVYVLLVTCVVDVLCVCVCVLVCFLCLVCEIVLYVGVLTSICVGSILLRWFYFVVHCYLLLLCCESCP